MVLKKFVFEMTHEDTPYNEENISELFGKDAAYNPDFPEHVLASEAVGYVFQDAICQVTRFKMDALKRLAVNEKDSVTERAFIMYLDKKLRIYEELRDSLKFVRSESIDMGV